MKNVQKRGAVSIRQYQSARQERMKLSDHFDGSFVTMGAKEVTGEI